MVSLKQGSPTHRRSMGLPELGSRDGSLLPHARWACCAHAWAVSCSQGCVVLKQGCVVLMCMSTGVLPRTWSPHPQPVYGAKKVGDHCLKGSNCLREVNGVYFRQGTFGDKTPPSNLTLFKNDRLCFPNMFLWVFFKAEVPERERERETFGFMQSYS